MALLGNLLLLLALCIICTRFSLAEDPLGNFCNKKANINGGSQIASNIKALLAELVSKAALNGYIATFSGSGEDKVYGLAQCRGDVSSKECSTCIRDAADQVVQRCPGQVEARIWFDYCFLRYGQDNFVGKVDTSVGIFYYNTGNVTDPDVFERKLGALMDAVRSQAVSSANKGLGKGETDLSPLVTLYALAQCTRDLPPLSCAQCVAIAVEMFGTICKQRKGCRVLYSSCYVRYELYPFFFPVGSNNRVTDTAMVMIYP